MDTEVENGETHDVGNNRTKTVGKDEISHIKQNRTARWMATKALPSAKIAAKPSMV